MNVTIEELMARDVETAEPGTTLSEARRRMREGGIHALPVVDDEGHPVGMLTSSDLLEGLPDDMTLGQAVTGKVFSVPRYDGVHLAARVMRNHGIHHVAVTDGGKLVGLLSSFDLLRLVEDHRFVMKNPPTESSRKGTRIG